MFRRASLLAVLVCAPLAAAPVPVHPKADAAVPESAAKLLGHRKLQKELKMTAEQRIGIVDALADTDEAFAKKFQELAKFPNLPEEAFDKLDREQEAARTKVFVDSAKGLTAAQQTRLRQLDVRVRGVSAFADPAIEKALQLTDAQKKKVRDAVAQVKTALTKYFDDDEGTETEQKERLFAFRAERQKDIEGALTKEQKELWLRLLGEKPAALDVNELWLEVEDETDALIPRP